MPFTRPTLTALVDTVEADVAARFPQAQTPLRRTVLGVLSRVFAGALHGLYGYQAWIAKQILPDTAEREYLDRHASLWGVGRVSAATAGGQVEFSGVDGATVPAGAVLRAGGSEYVVLADAVIAAGVALTGVEALKPGAAGNLPANRVLTFVSPATGVAAEAVVDAAGLTGGADEETDATLRSRLLERLRLRPMGGAAGDYAVWARDADPLITRVWVRPGWMGLGTVGVTFVYDGRAGITPTVGEIAAVQAYIDARRPVTAEAVVFAPVLKAIPMTIDLTPDTAKVRAAVEAVLDDFYTREAEPGATILISQLREVVSSASGERDSDVSVPAANVACLPAELAVRGAITWV